MLRVARNDSRARDRRFGLARLLLVACGGLAASAALAQPVTVNPDALAAAPPASVDVDLGALGALGPAPGNAAPPVVTLRAPPPRPAVAPPAQNAAVAPRPQAAPPPPGPRLAAPAPPATAPAAPRVAAAAAPSVGTASALAPGRPGMVRFAKDGTDIPPDGQTTLNGVAAALAGNAKLRLQLVAYASRNPDDPIAARRISLARAVQLRTYLIEKGVPSVRMDVRALGDKLDGDGPPDRVDLVLLDH